MGGQFSYERCPQSPTEMSKKPSRPKWKFWVTVCALAATLVLFFTFLVLYVKERSECESRRYNHTFSAEGKMTGSDALRAQLAAVNQSLANTTEHWDSCKEELKHWRENTSVLEGAVKAKEEALKHLEAVNQSLAKTTENWTSCEKELKHWRENTSVLEGAVKAKEEALKHLEAVNQSLAKTTENWTSCEKELKHSRKNTSVLEGAVKAKDKAFKHLEEEKTRLQNQLSQLNNSLENYKREGNKKDKTIQRLKDQLNTRQTSSGMVLSPSFLIPSLLLFIAPGVLCSLL
uniref:spindle pole body component 110-like isoform X1 n=1 Tax=Podarcis muralis TaxID=64176 RepID=UPI0010A09F92|nr:spindle pole body component 110-like isoform X1 [Podarcis muralis]